MNLVGEDYERIAATLPIPMLCAGADERVVWANPVARRLLGISGDHDNLLDHVALRDPETLRRAIGSSSWVPLRVEIRNGDRRGMSILFRARGMRLPDREAPILVMVRDDDDSRAFAEHSRLVARLNAELREQHRLRRDLSGALEREAHLHRELIHRVKNNLTLLAAIVSNRRREPVSPDTDAVLSDIQMRIRAVGLVHDVLDLKMEIDVVDAEEVLERLCDQMRLAIVPEGVELTCELVPFPLAVEDATPLCLLVNELVTNALKHGVPDGGRIEVNLRRNGHDKLEIEISDDGSGFGDGQGKRARARVVDALAQQLNGDLTQGESPLGGARWTLVFPPRAIDTMRSGRVRPKEGAQP